MDSSGFGGAALVTTMAPASAAWRGYISHPLGFAFAAPGELKVEKGTYKAAIGGTHDTLVFRAVDDNIEYKAIVIDMTAQANQAATILGEAEYIFQDGKKVLMDTFGRVDGKYGRKLTIDLPNKSGRTTAAFISSMAGSSRSRPRCCRPMAITTPGNGSLHRLDYVLHSSRGRRCDRTDAAEINRISGGHHAATQLLISACAAMAVMTAPANAAWHSYISHKLGFSFEAPGEVKVQTGTYRGQAAGPKETIVFRSVDDNIEYKVTVMSFAQAQAEGANILGEREFMFQGTRRFSLDTFARVEPGKDSVYGRKMTVDLPRMADGRRPRSISPMVSSLRLKRPCSGQWRLHVARSGPLYRLGRVRAQPHARRRNRARLAESRMTIEDTLSPSGERARVRGAAGRHRPIWRRWEVWP